MLPLLQAGVVGALVYGFVRAVTTVSAVVFLVTAEYELATTYIILRVINGDYGLAIAYSCALIVLMLAVILLIQFAGRRAAAGPARRRSPDPGRPRVSVEFRERRASATARRPRVAGVSFTVEAGTLVTLLGPSGCGKTTTLRMIAGLELPSEGRILIAGRDVTKLGATRARRQHGVPVLRPVPAHERARERRATACAARAGQGRGATTGRAKALKQVGLEGFDERLPSRAVGRPAAARRRGARPGAGAVGAAVRRAAVNLDARLRRQMREEIRELQQRLGLTVVYVTHDQRRRWRCPTASSS